MFFGNTEGGYLTMRLNNKSFGVWLASHVHLHTLSTPSFLARHPIHALLLALILVSCTRCATADLCKSDDNVVRQEYAGNSQVVSGLESVCRLLTESEEVSEQSYRKAHSLLLAAKREMNGILDSSPSFAVRLRDMDPPLCGYRMEELELRVKDLKRKAIAEDDPIEAALYLIHRIHAEGKLEEALPLQHPDSPYVKKVTTIAVALFQNGNKQRAREVLAQISELKVVRKGHSERYDHLFPKQLFNTATRIGEYQSARRYLDDYIDRLADKTLYPDTVVPRELASLGAALASTGMHDAARRYFMRSLEAIVPELKILKSKTILPKLIESLYRDLSMLPMNDDVSVSGIAETLKEIKSKCQARSYGLSWVAAEIALTKHRDLAQLALGLAYFYINCTEPYYRHYSKVGEALARLGDLDIIRAVLNRDYDDYLAYPPGLRRVAWEESDQQRRREQEFDFMEGALRGGACKTLSEDLDYVPYVHKSMVYDYFELLLAFKQYCHAPSNSDVVSLAIQRARSFLDKRAKDFDPGLSKSKLRTDYARVLLENGDISAARSIASGQLEALRLFENWPSDKIFGGDIAHGPDVCEILAISGRSLDSMKCFRLVSKLLRNVWLVEYKLREAVIRLATALAIAGESQEIVAFVKGILPRRSIPTALVKILLRVGRFQSAFGLEVGEDLRRFIHDQL